jgi:hypothetical protein
MPKQGLKGGGSGPPRKKQASLSSFFSNPARATTSSVTARGAASSSSLPQDETKNNAEHEHSQSPPFKIYCDLDGVLVDFDAGVLKLFGGNNNKRFKTTSDIPSGLLWSSIARAGTFYTHLDWMPDGKDLWRTILPLQPNILTGVPMQKVARDQKADWCRRELGFPIVGDGDSTSNSVVVINHVDMAGPKKAHELVNGTRRKNASGYKQSKSSSSAGDNNNKQQQCVDVITCWSTNKHVECTLDIHSASSKCVLIDDRDKLASAWTKAGGIFVHHTSTKNTLQQLRDLGILPSELSSKSNVDTDIDIDVSQGTEDNEQRKKTGKRASPSEKKVAASKQNLEKKNKRALKDEAIELGGSSEDENEDSEIIE